MSPGEFRAVSGRPSSIVPAAYLNEWLLWAGRNTDDMDSHSHLSKTVHSVCFPRTHALIWAL